MCDDLPKGISLLLHTYSMDRHSALLIPIKNRGNLSFTESSKGMIKCSKTCANVLATLLEGMPKSESNDRTEIQHSLTVNGEG